MKFREQGNKVQALAYCGYDKVKKKSIIKMVATYDPTTYEVTYVQEDDGKERATSAMKNEITEHLKNIKESAAKSRELSTFQDTLVYLSECGRLIEGNSELAEKFGEFSAKYSEQEISAVWRALHSVEKQLEANGHPRPKRQYKKPADQKDPRQVDLLAKA